jgi:hypothetical protein
MRLAQGLITTGLLLLASLLTTHIDLAKSNITQPATELGGAIATSGSTVVVAAETAGRGGQVRVYTRTGEKWSLAQTLNNPGATDGQGFGWSVALSGSTLIVGAPFTDTTTTDGGVAYVYPKSGSRWSLGATLEVAGTTDFGQAVATDGSAAMINANQLSAYVFTQADGSWRQTATLEGPGNGDPYSLALWNSAAGPLGVDGAPFGDPASVADVWAPSGGTWRFQDELVPPAGDGAFGLAVAGAGNLVVVGAPDYARCGAGFVYRLRGRQWARLNHLRPEGCPAGSAGGSAVAISGSTVLLGAPGERGCGEVYAYRVAGRSWTLLRTFRPPACRRTTRFGNAVALVAGGPGLTAVIGAPGTDHGAGAVYFRPI